VTVSEARVAQLLLDGKALAEISVKLHVTRNTLKTPPEPDLPLDRYEAPSRACWLYSSAAGKQTLSK
jgi:hypothetical protein